MLTLNIWYAGGGQDENLGMGWGKTGHGFPRIGTDQDSDPGGPGCSPFRQSRGRPVSQGQGTTSIRVPSTQPQLGLHRLASYWVCSAEA
jgi:hypothetical protein